jgi:hypothetical protein
VQDDDALIGGKVLVEPNLTAKRRAKAKMRGGAAAESPATGK